MISNLFHKNNYWQYLSHKSIKKWFVLCNFSEQAGLLLCLKIQLLLKNNEIKTKYYILYINEGGL